MSKAKDILDTVSDSDGSCLSYGSGSAFLLKWNDNRVVKQWSLDVCWQYNVKPQKLIWLDDLTNGGQKGAGLKVLELGLQQARQLNKILILCAKGNQKLCDWYQSTNLLKLVKVTDIRWPVFVDVQVDIKPVTRSVEWTDWVKEVCG